MTCREFCTGLIESTGVMLTPGDAFEMEGYARIGYANDRELLEAGLHELSSYLGEMR
jgi:aspartate/methionine/tyrosine aminotransferase